ncbi:hypothetical protein AG1IA_08993 [Rhizoctonia solani AG-1 IA]|uniref:Uncharacterized protein n=1 Tax=Thanatephorus cucumeris (strain AG1-IA) TaxID=983506 RepID=L8WJI5_THACA|nr:hypothetical protein AG1IA_08993 [Rhizoctonia solani AG-1 IA]
MSVSRSGVLPLVMLNLLFSYGQFLNTTPVVCRKHWITDSLNHSLQAPPIIDPR